MNNEGIVNIRIKTGPSRITKIENFLDIDEEKMCLIKIKTREKHKTQIHLKISNNDMYM